ncbi:uncharacterized protein TNCV_4198281 [Trichonephila clavipes]|nr:uncharacterized protein TNCV_4198281 [Trichonephila clavipes]
MHVKSVEDKVVPLAWCGSLERESQSGNESDSTLSINASESDSEITDCFESPLCRSSGTAVSDLDCGVLGPGRRAASPLVSLVEKEERWKFSDHPQGVLPLNWGGTELNHTATCMVLKATANDGRKSLALCHDGFRGPRSDTVRQVELEITTSSTNHRTFKSKSHI